MSPILAILKKDLTALFTNSMFYLLTGICCCLWGLFFSFELYAFVQKSYQLSTQVQQGGLNIHQHLVSSYIVIVHYILVFIIAALSIRFFAEEKKLNTFPVLLTSPITSWQIVFAKWLVGASLIFFLLFISAIFPLSLLTFMSLPIKLFLYSYFGVFVVLCVYMSAGLLASSLTESLIVCVVLSLMFNICLLLMGVGRELTDSLIFQELFGFLAIDQHFATFRKGIFSFSSIVYLLSLSGLFGLMTERVVEYHRWR